MTENIKNQYFNHKTLTGKQRYNFPPNCFNAHIHNSRARLFFFQFTNTFRIATKKRNIEKNSVLYNLNEKVNYSRSIKTRLRRQ